MAVRNAATEAHRGKLVFRFTKVCNTIAGINDTDMCNMRANCSKKVGYPRREIVAGITGNRSKIGRAGVIVENEMVIGKSIFGKRRIIGIGSANYRSSTWPPANKHRSNFFGTKSNSGSSSRYET